MATPETQQWIDRYEKNLWNTFGRRRLVLTHGKGTRVWDIDGNEYLDFLAGIAVTNLGHSHPAIVEAIQKQAARLIHCSNFYYIPAQIEWAEYLTRHSFGGRVFFGNSGAEANEGMIKAARKYAVAHFPPNRRTILSCFNSFHGRTIGTLSATGQEKVQAGFDPLAPGFRFVEYNNCDQLRDAIDGSVLAVLVEPVQGEGGVVPATQEFMNALAEVRESYNVLLLFDEVQTGLGRTGKNFGYEHYGVAPDIMSLGKPVAGGLAAGAIVAREEIASHMLPGSHGSTMGGNPMAAAAGRAYCKVLFEEGLAERAAKMGEKAFSVLRPWVKEIPCVKDVRGMGLMIGIELDRPAVGVVERCEKRGLLINYTAQTVVRLVPPLTVSEDEMERALEILRNELMNEKDPPAQS
ncbi:aspartate aminotransferase family protein [Candidatus Sumerlaeota bacterium]|nr:aspartate aminotransferase family protein [Candidatus Sumerlaeota bacterium]